MTWPADPARAKIVEAVSAATVIGSPGFLEWDRGEPLGRQAWRRFSVLADGGDLTSLTKAPAIGAGGIVYVDRTYSLTVYYERGKNKQSLGKDSDALTNAAERLVGALCRMDYAPPPPRRGLGDLGAGLAAALGIRPWPGCGCRGRRRWLNRAGWAALAALGQSAPLGPIPRGIQPPRAPD